MSQRYLLVEKRLKKIQQKSEFVVSRAPYQRGPETRWATNSRVKAEEARLQEDLQSSQRLQKKSQWLVTGLLLEMLAFFGLSG